MEPMFVILSVGGVVGLAMLIVGWRGQRVGDHPHCAQCEFDLFGLAPDAGQCPECGAAIDGKRATVHGERTQRWKLFSFGAAIFLVCVLLGGTSAWHRSQQISIYPYLPTSLLIRIVRMPEARDELASRLNAGKLTEQATRRLLDHALDAQGNPNETWTHNSTWGEVIDDAILDGHATDEQIDRYLTNALRWELQIRDHLQVGRVPRTNLGLLSGWKRFGPQSQIDVTVHLDEFEIRGQPVAFDDALRDELRRMSYGLTRTTYLGGGSLPVEQIGTQLGVTSVDATVRTTVTGSVGGMKLGRTVTTELERLVAEVQVVDEPTGNYVELSTAEQEDSAGVWLIHDQARGQSEPVLAFALKSGPQLALTYWIRDGDQVWRVRPQMSGSDGNSFYAAFWQSELEKGSIGKGPPKRVDLIIRPDIEAAELSPYGQRSWLGEWVFEDVPLDSGWITSPQEIQHVYSSSDEAPPPLARPRTRVLTLEEAEQPPVVE